MSIGIERLSADLMPRRAAGDGRGGAGEGPALRQRVALWEDMLTLVVDPERPMGVEPARKRAALSFLLARAGIGEDRFWKLARGRRGRLFLSRYSRVSRDIPQLEITSFDLDKLLKERYRQEPLTLGAAWHHGFWRSYFSHAAITHPANDGLREEFSTAWDLVRKHPAVLFRTADGQRSTPLRAVRLDLPMIVGPLPYSDGVTMERAYLEAIAAADPERDLHTRSLVVVEAARCLEHRAAFRAHAADLLPRLSPGDAAALAGAGDTAEPLRELVRGARVVELEWSEGLEASGGLAENRDLIGVRREEVRGSGLRAEVELMIGERDGGCQRNVEHLEQMRVSEHETRTWHVYELM